MSAVLSPATSPAFPAPADPLAGQILDVDGHMILEPPVFKELIQGLPEGGGFALDFQQRSGGEEAVSPYLMLVVHMAAEVYLQVMVMGGVFERFPRLRFGIFEFGTTWFGLACQRMDNWASFLARVGRKYELKPSEFVRRNVRIGPFPNEDLPGMIRQYGLHECWCFSTDYCHLEGSRDPIRKFRKMTDEVGPGYDKAFFVDNPAWLFPGLDPH